MTTHSIQQLCLYAALAYILASSAQAGAINDPVVTINSTSTLQQTLSVTITETGAPGGTTINYTTDGTNPSQSSASIASGSTLLLAQNALLQVEAFQSATSTSNIVTEKYAIAGQVSAGTAHTLILLNNGTVFAAGDNTYGELGNGLTSIGATSTPVQVMTSSTTYLTGVVAIAAGNGESYAVDASGKVWAWGANTNSQLGLGTSTNILYATQISSLSNMVEIAAAQYHVLALRADGTVWGFGSDSYGESGNGATSAWLTTPTEVSAPTGAGYLTGVVAVAAGANHSLVLTSAGNVYSFGSNASGQLGNNDATLASKSKPVQVQRSGAALANIVGIAAGASDSFALTNTGAALSFGANDIGELGQGSVNATPVTANLSAAAVAGLPEPMVALSSQMALGSDGTLFSWGDNSTARLGVGVTGYYATLPLAVTLATPSTPTLTATAGNGQTVIDGQYSSAFTLTASNSGTPLANTWVNFVTSPANGSIGLTSGASQLSPIIGGFTNSSGQVSFYLLAEGTGTVPLTATSGATQSSLSAIEQAPAGDTGPVGYWQLNEGTGTTTVDASGNSNNGTLTSSPSWVTGEFGGALNFNGTSSYVDLNNTTSSGALKPPLPVTISAWIKLTSASGYQAIFASDNFNSVYAGCLLETNGGKLECVYATGDNSFTFRSKVGTTVMSAGQWYHVAAVIQGPTTMNLYVNGVDDGGTYAGTGTGLGYTTTSSKIGCRNGSTYFNGAIDDVRFYNRVLSSTEVELLANPPVGNWRLDEGSGTTALDSGTAGITGTLTNSPGYTTGWFGNALNFNGTSSYVSLNNASSTNPLKPSLPVTVSAWIKLATSTGIQTIFSSDSFNNPYYGYDMKITSGALSCDYGSGTNAGPAYRRSKNGTTILTAGQWYHVVAVIQSATSMNLYVNGVDDGGSYNGTGGAMVYSSAPSKIGTDTSVNYFNGVIDDVRVYGRALSATEVQVLDNASSGVIPPQ
jgi:alpha-tubulin suppressor-like RCC1 family protein